MHKLGYFCSSQSCTAYKYWSSAKRGFQTKYWPHILIGEAIAIGMREACPQCKRTLFIKPITSLDLAREKLIKIMREEKE